MRAGRGVGWEASSVACALAGVLAAVLSFAGCSSAPKPTRVEGSIEASAQINPSVSRRPSPLLVRVYELKSKTQFDGADFMSLYQRDQEELAADLLAREDVMLQPGETRPFAKTLAPETRFIGVVAAYRNLERAVWRAVVPVQLGKKNKLVIRADELSVTATVSQ